MANENPDAREDYEEICRVVEEKLAPVFAQVGTFLNELKGDVDGLKDFAERLTGGLGEAVSAHRRSGLEAMLSEKFGPDMEVMNPFFQDIAGKDYSTALLDTLMESDDDMDEDSIRNIIEADKGRIGKYIGLQMPPAEEQTEEMVAEPKEEAEEEHEELGKEPPGEEEPEEADESGTDEAGKMKDGKKLGAQRGRVPAPDGDMREQTEHDEGGRDGVIPKSSYGREMAKMLGLKVGSRR